jgi:hypothetical protein
MGFVDARSPKSAVFGSLPFQRQAVEKGDPSMGRAPIAGRQALFSVETSARPAYTSLN